MTALVDQQMNTTTSNLADYLLCTY